MKSNLPHEFFPVSKKTWFSIKLLIITTYSIILKINIAVILNYMRDDNYAHLSISVNYKIKLHPGLWVLKNVIKNYEIYI